MLIHDPSKAVIFDGDDTLWAIQSFYDEAKEAFFSLMEHQGFSRPRVEKRFAEIDHANVAEYGFSRLRFPQSMQDTYKYLAQHSGVKPNTLLLDKVYEIGSTVFERKPELLPGSTDTLLKLKTFYRLFLYSVGDLEVQWKKVNDLHLEPFFEHIYITERKTSDQLAQILVEQHLQPASSWMVGNSLRSDINPALRLGLRCIWFQAHSWDYDHDALRPGHIWRVSNLDEIPDLLARVDMHVS